MKKVWLAAIVMMLGNLSALAQDEVPNVEKTRQLVPGGASA